jgi:hypothetical protein
MLLGIKCYKLPNFITNTFTVPIQLTYTKTNAHSKKPNTKATASNPYPLAWTTSASLFDTTGEADFVVEDDAPMFVGVWLPLALEPPDTEPLTLELPLTGAETEFVVPVVFK